MLVNKAYKFRLYPSIEQEILINKTFGCTRLVYNNMLSKVREDKSLTRFDMNKLIPTLNEKLSINKMLEKKENNKGLRKEINNVTFSEIIRKIEYKCKWLNKTYITVDRYYRSSQTCSVCGKIDKSMKDLRKREYKCKHCNSEIDRDLNASINIMIEGVFNYFRNKIKTA